MSYLDKQSNAARMLSDKGQVVTIAGATGGTYDPATGSNSTTPYNVTASAVFLPLNPYKVQQGGNVQPGDETMLLSALDSAGAAIAQPPNDSVITLGSGKKYALIEVVPLHPDGTELLFDCTVRGYS